MPTCHVTGIEIHLSEAFVLCAPAAARLLHRRMHQVRLLEMLLQEYGRMQPVQTMDAQGLLVNRKQARLICEAIVEAWSQELEGSQELFITFSEWCERGRVRKKQKITMQQPANPEKAEADHEPER